MNKHTLKRYIKAISTDDVAVSSIEYALFGSLIAVVIVGAVGALGTRTAFLFNLVANCATFATTGIGSCA